MARVSDAHLEARRQSILAAATKIFSQKGIAAATMAEIASEAGISPGAIYRYFENKEQLASGCMNESAEAIKKAWSNPAALETSFTELAAMTFAEIDKPDESIDTQMFLEQALIAVRTGDDSLMKQFQDEHLSVREGIAYLMRRDFGDRLAPFDIDRLSDALYSFYWGVRLVKMMVPDSDPIAQYQQVQQMMDRSFGPGHERSN
ncbi:MAG: TetR/AcrR family transcriptional regulator [Dehalococcoidia bacterium]